MGLTPNQMKAEIERLKELEARLRESNTIAVRTYNLMAYRIMGDSKLLHCEVCDIFKKRAEREYAFFKKHGRNPTEDESVQLENL